MDNKLSGIERAFQLAKSGQVNGIDELHAVLRKEGHSSMALDGPSLQKTTTRAH
jgi:hypothetical protein